MKQSDRSTSERVYQAVKQQLLSGAFHPGDRIEAGQLAQLHLASVTPVRAALYRLVGEGLVEARASEGFRAPHITEHGLRDLYAWNGQVLLLALQLAAPGALAPGFEPLEASPHSADASGAFETTERLFNCIAEQSASAQCKAAIRSLNDRLHLVRRLEGDLFGDTGEELDSLVSSFVEGREAEIRRGISAYHRRRVGAAADFVGLIYKLAG